MSHSDQLKKAQELFFDGVSCMEQQDYFGAEIAFREALTLAPDRVSIITNLTGALVKQKKIDEATEYANRSVALDPVNKFGLINLGLCFVEPVSMKRRLPVTKKH